MVGCKEPILIIAHERFVFQGVHMMVDRTAVGRPWPPKKCGSTPVFIGRNLDACELRDGVAACGAGRLP
jgi:G3E family GTPase